MNPLFRKNARLRRLYVWSRRIGVAALLFGAVAWTVWLLLPKPELFPADLAFSRQVFDADGKLLHLSLTPDGRYRLPANLDEIAPSVLAATIEKEDRRYFAHAGVDLRSVARAAWGVASGQRLGGGSTLTMQYARLRWGLKTRSWWGKAAQAFRAVQLERHYAKRDLLEAYLTLAPYGGNVEGITAASVVWCGKSPALLSEREAVALSVLPQSPTLRRPRHGPNPHLAAAQARLFAQLRGHGSELDAQFTLSPTGAPRNAPHFSRRLLRENPRAPVIQTTLHMDQQIICERVLSDFLARWHDRGLRNAAAVLVHAPSRQVRAYAGSAAFLDDRICGQVDGVTARRSPGSALKPFIYALALDAGLIHPGTLLDDAPRRFAGYDPENSDRAFLGPVPAAEALRRSRNVPAVELLAALPKGGLDRFLRKSGVKLARPPGEYGLALALGGAEMSLEELAVLYSALASDGVARPLCFTAAQAKLSREAQLSPGARWLTLEALRNDGRNGLRDLSWKTGTSHGFRDAWACGVAGEWVLCVWVGHFDAKPMPGLFARDTAAPLLFEMVSRLGLNGPAATPPPSVVQAALCSDSGMVASSLCAHQRHGPFLAGVSPISVCDVHREVFLNERGLRVAPGDPAGKRTAREFWPQHRMEQFRRAGLPRSEPPAWAAEAANNSYASPPRITSPESALTYVLQPNDASKGAIPLQARVAPGVRRVHWFTGAQYLGSCHPSEPFLWSPPPGRWSVQATDDLGRAAAVSVVVLHASR